MTTYSEIIECELNDGGTHQWRPAPAMEIIDPEDASAQRVLGVVKLICPCGAGCLISKELYGPASGF